MQQNIITNAHIGLHVKYRYACQILMKLEFFQKIFEIYSSVKFHEHPSVGNRAAPRGQADTQTRQS